MKKVFFLILAVIIFVFAENAGAVSLLPGGMVSFRFDDGLSSQYDIAKNILAEHGFPATLYLFTDPLQEGNWDGYINKNEALELQNVYGWEIGSHTKSHPYLTQLSEVNLIKELSDSKSILQSMGFSIKSFVSPFGDWDNKVLSHIAKLYNNHGSAGPYGLNQFPHNDYAVMVQEAQASTSVQTIKGWIDQAESEGKWLVLLFHGITESDPTLYEYLKDGFEEVVEYVSSKNMPVVNISSALDLPGENIIVNPSFESDGGWAGDVVVDSNNNGSFPDPLKSLKVVGNTSVRTGKMIDVVHGQLYVLKSYFNCQEFSSGGVDVYIDEYDSAGNWVNWKWQTGIWQDFVGYRSVLYTPSSSDVKKVLVWFKSSASSDLTCYIDNVILKKTGVIIPQEPTTPSLIPNAGFDTVIDGWAKDWIRTDNINSVIENNKLKIVGSAQKQIVRTENYIDISLLKKYSLKIDWDCPVFSSGGVDVYIDEYDSAGNWVNWKWQTGIWQDFTGQKSVNYIPSYNAKKILIWFEVPAGSSLNCHIDNIILSESEDILSLNIWEIQYGEWLRSIMKNIFNMA